MEPPGATPAPATNDIMTKGEPDARHLFWGREVANPVNSPRRQTAVPVPKGSNGAYSANFRGERFHTDNRACVSFLLMWEFKSLFGLAKV
jgi:hypothetical protein